MSCWISWRPRLTPRLMRRPAPPSRSATKIADGGAGTAQAAAIADTANSSSPSSGRQARRQSRDRSAKDRWPSRMPKRSENREPVPPCQAAHRRRHAECRRAAGQAAAAPNAADPGRRRPGRGRHRHPEFQRRQHHPSAVFVRGLTAWIVLENAANLDGAALKTTLASFASGIEASSSPGVSILRITLKQPPAITAQDNGAGPESRDRRPESCPRPPASALRASRTIPSTPRLLPSCPAPTRAFAADRSGDRRHSHRHPRRRRLWHAGRARLCGVRRTSQRQRPCDHALCRRSGGFGSRHAGRHQPSRRPYPHAPGAPLGDTPQAMAEDRQRAQLY